MRSRRHWHATWLDAQSLVNAGQRFARESKSTQQRFIPHPAKWLDEDRFLEQLQGSAECASHSADRQPKAPMFSAEEMAVPTEEDKAKVRRLLSGLTTEIGS